MSTEIEFRVLGPLEVRVGGRPVVVAAAKQRALLAALLLRANQVVPAGELIGCLWGERPPAGARNTLRTYVMRLRQSLGEAAVLRTAPDGYAIDVPPGALDADRFRELVGRARSAEDESAWSLLTGALALWRGPVLADTPMDSLRHNEIIRLDEELLHARERRAEVGLRLGRHAELVPELRELVAENPAREQLAAHLMIALYRSSRRADALHTYREVYDYLAEELGVDPGAELTAAHQAVLSDDPALLTPLPAKQSTASVPAQLPPDVINFVGRAELLRRIREQLATDPPPQATPVVLLTGPPGIGKTALAVHLAHQVKALFPDGQLFVDLRGYARGPALSAGQVLARFLRALGVAPEAVPADEDEQSATYRSLLTGRRMLIVLDNAAHAPLVRQLLPGDPGCAVLVTSRDAMRGLVAAQGARQLQVGALAPEESSALLERMVGRQAVLAEPEAASELAELCTHLPLALRIAAANLLGGGEPQLADQVAQLREGNRLAELSAEGDETVTVRAAFDLSYEALTVQAQQVFRLLGLIPCADCTPDALAALLEVQHDQARRLLDRLLSANLVQAPTPGRYQLHDLLRAYAHERSAAEDEPSARQAAVHRLLAHNLLLANEAARLLGPEIPRLVDQPEPTSAPRFGSREQALEWVSSELSNLVALVQHAAANEPKRVAWQLVDALRVFFYVQRLTSVWHTVAVVALDAAVRAGDEVAEAAMHHSIGALDWSMGRAGEAAQRSTRALEIFRRHGRTDGQYSALTNLAIALLETGDLAGAATRFAEALDIAQEHAEPARQAPVLLNLGLVRMTLGQTEDGLAYLARARAICAQFGIEHGELACLSNLMQYSRDLGCFEPMEQYFSDGVALSRRLGMPDAESGLLEAMAQVHLDFGRLDEAFELVGAALELASRPGMVQCRIAAMNTLGQAQRLAGRSGEAVASHREALRLSRQAEFRVGEVQALIGLGYALGGSEQGLDCARSAVSVSRRHQLLLYEGHGLLAVAQAHLIRAEHVTAGVHAEHALSLFRRTGLRLWEARALGELAKVREATDDHVTAAVYRGQSDALFAEMGLKEQT
ncbi:BTAD domain-containing putative transcriptional regulator [Kutzneria viridogrisea]|uniref:SARP family transcription regulator n=2 Tax=Kutzneria TaxID=43356 RepID=W5W6U9_9PSEU|nr:BTAD domain-containing putative transcriptional regulator [Kutzneria albida]AHH93929.1 SARP family transcription regulator [Kutzneria albida DSM 43870]MBA8931066.1 DNA-binding SARP family transcriptional activator/DNA polymerase III delta prime subunit [Kutzneria viridogrisea]